MKILALTIQGDTDNTYTISADGTRGLVCTCPAFTFSKATPAICKHIKYVQKTLVKA